MIFLVLTILSGAMISILMRFSEGKITGKFSMFAANYLTCIILAGSSTGWKTLSANLSYNDTTFVLGIINGVFYLSGLVLMQYNIKQNGVVLSSVFSRLGGLLIPLAVAIGIFNENPTITQVVGAIIAIFAIILVNYDKENLHANTKWMLLLLFLSDGCATSLAKVFQKMGNNNLKANYLFYTFTVALILCIGLIFYKKEKISWKEIVFGVAIGIPNFFGSHLLLKTLEKLPAVVVYPTRGVGGIMVVSLAGIYLFHEKLRKSQWIAIGFILISVVLLNIN